jgi:hypothetical protein
MICPGNVDALGSEASTATADLASSTLSFGGANGGWSNLIAVTDPLTTFELNDTF